MIVDNNKISNIREDIKLIHAMMTATFCNNKGYVALVIGPLGMMIVQIVEISKSLLC